MLLPVDAGADYVSFLSETTGYDLVQTAANAGRLESVVKLVEAGASWRLARGQPRALGCVSYVPEILMLNCRSGSGLKVGTVLTQLLSVLITTKHIC